MVLNRVVAAKAPGDARIVEREIPELPADDYILVKTTAVAINPTDWKHVEAADKMNCLGCVVGCDYAGIVEKVGPGVKKPFKKGDRICGAVNGSNAVRKEDGTFAEYIVVKSDMQISTPDNLSDEEAATLGIAITTIGQGLYQTLGLPLPTEPAKEPFPIFIYGGSTAMGITGIQFAKASGLTVVTTASPKNFDYMRSLGADAVFDYKSPTLVDDVRKFTDGKLAYTWDCQAEGESGRICAEAMASSGGKYAALLYGTEDKVRAANSKVEPAVTIYYSAFGEPWAYKGAYDAVPADFEFAAPFWDLSRKLLADGTVKPIRVIKNQGGSGLEGVLQGLQDMKEGKYSAGKLVYTL